MSKEYEDLREFMLERMRMSHIYQPVMLKTLIESGGKATLRKIAAAFLARDESQLEYYGEITKAMPGKVLSKHGIVERDGKGYRLTADVEQLSPNERKDLLQLCDDAVERYLGKRGSAAYDHRRAALGQISGSLRYEVLKRAGGRCELCGISVEERAIEIDHITPRRHGGTDDLTNLQALCYKCNANKGARDDTDFRQVRESLNHRRVGCVFCEIPADRIVASNDLTVAICDAHPVTTLHSLIIPRRHATTYFDLFEPERRAISLLLDGMRSEILKRDAGVTGFNVGINCGEAAGQTVDHAHVHLIPRRAGDVDNPRGGVRGVIPGKANYQ
jgi:diadenosine tetraphosphate (Ap4A) HIT family hydrolase/5-methylcytosine-specific restriction endonuclease McrA